MVASMQSRVMRRVTRHRRRRVHSRRLGGGRFVGV